MGSNEAACFFLVCSLRHCSRAAFCLQGLSTAFAVVFPEKWTQGSHGQLRVFQVLQMLRPRSESLPLCFSRALCITSYNQKATPSPWVSLEVYRKVVHVGSLNVWEARAAVWLVLLSHLQRVDRTGMQGKLNRWQTYAVSVLRAWNLCRACGAGCQSHGDPTNLPFSIPRGSLVWSARSFHLGSESFLVLFKMEARL